MARLIHATLLVLALVGVASALPHFDLGSSITPTPEMFAQWMSHGGETWTGSESVPELRQKLIRRVLKWGIDEITDVKHDFEDVKRAFAYDFSPKHVVGDLRNMLHDAVHSDVLTELEKDAEGLFRPLSSTTYPYFGFIPTIEASLKVGAAPSSWSSWCWDTTTAQATKASDGTVTVTITVPTGSHQKSLFCADSYAAMTVASMKMFIHVGSVGAHSFTWNTTNLTPAEQWDLDTNGIRLFHFANSTLTTVGQIIDTALMFAPMLSKSVSSAAAARNTKFMAEYANRDMKARTITEVDLPEDQIQSGDFFGIIRLDGLDPMLAWAMGSTTGHTTIAVRDETNELYIHESTAKDSYWPTNGIQKTPFKQWIAQAKAASFNVVHAPLNAENRAKFNVTAALEFFSTVEGLNYGYHNMLWGWIDTLKDNYPCVPPYPVTEDSTCLQWDLVMTLFSVLNKGIPALGDLLFKQAWNFRLNTTGLEPPQLYQLAASKGMNPAEIPTIPEQDAWKYNTTRYGKPAVGESMVCCVFVCHMWKAGGIFGEHQENCGEFTNADDYRLTIFETSPPPAMCQKADPGNPVCQLLGSETLTLNDYHTKDIFTLMDQTCPSLPPDYSQPATC